MFPEMDPSKNESPKLVYQILIQYSGVLLEICLLVGTICMGNYLKMRLSFVFGAIEEPLLGPFLKETNSKEPLNLTNCLINAKALARKVVGKLEPLTGTATLKL